MPETSHAPSRPKTKLAAYVAADLSDALRSEARTERRTLSGQLEQILDERYGGKAKGSAS